MSEAPQLLVGLMSGTSLDGVDAALVRIAGVSSLELIAFAQRPYSGSERARIEGVLGGSGIAEAARLHVALSEWAGEAVEGVLRQARVRPDALAAIAMHGQTVWHEAPSVSWQLGDPALLAERFGVRVVHDFRARDVAAGGQGAPLVPIADALCFGAVDHPRILLNIGGMANVTWVRRRGETRDVAGGDTGPGMALTDALSRMVNPALPFDVDGALARAGRVDHAALERLLAHPFFGEPLPRSTGREQFGTDFARRLGASVPGVDGVRTSVALTAESIWRCCRDLLPEAGEVLVSGGGARHPVLMEELRTRFATRGTALRLFEEEFFSGQAKEAVAFALLGWLRLHGQPGNVPAVTGAQGPRVLGSVAAG